MNGSRAWLEKDFYKILGVPETASAEDVKKVYRKLARAHHPDRNPGDKAAEEKMKEISEAYDVLSDPKKRAEYDRVRRLAASGAGAGFRGFGGGTDGFNVRFDGADFDLGDLFSNVFGAGAGGRRGRRGQDVEAEVHVGFEEAARGATVSVPVHGAGPCSACGGSGDRSGRARTCEACHGTGSTGENQGLFSFVRSCDRCGGSGRVVEDPCRTCGGSGLETRAQDIRVRVPAGVADGARIRVRGRGRPGNAGPAGDLFVTVHVTPHPSFGRRGADLTLTVPITFAEAALGGDMEVPTLDGPVRVRIPPGTQNGRTFRVRGRGLARPKGGHGDLLVSVRVTVPERLSGEERELLERFARLRNESPRAGMIV